MNRCEAVEAAVADVCVSGSDTLLRHGGEAIFNSWQLEGDSCPSPIMMAGVRTRYWEDGGDYRDRLLQVFSKIDKDRDGSITRDELRQYCEDDGVEDAIKAMDIDQDGNISFEEFYACFKKVTPMLDRARPIFSTPRESMATSYVIETSENDDTLEWESIMKKFSIDSESPLFQSKELRELIGRMEHQSPHLLDTMEQVISFLHADWQQLKRDCDNLHSKLKRESHHTVEQAMEYDETLKEQLEKERETFVTKEHQLKSKLEKQLREKEDYILQVLGQKRKLEEQLNMKEKEQVSLQQQNKELETAIKYKEKEQIHSSRSTPVRRKRYLPSTSSSTDIVDKKNRDKLMVRSSTMESYCSDHDESCDEAPVSFELSGYQVSSLLTPSHVDHMAQRSKSAISLAEEIEQLNQQDDVHPVTLCLPSAEISCNSSSTHVTSDNMLPGGISAEWSPAISPSITNSLQPSPSPYFGSSDSGRESPISVSHDHRQHLYRSHNHNESRSHDHNESRSHDHQRSVYSDESHDQQHSHTRGSHDQHYCDGESHDHQHYHDGGSHDQHYHNGSHDQGQYETYIGPDSYSCPNLSTLEDYGEKRRLQHFSNNGHSAIWDDRYHNNCASMSSIHLQSGTSHDCLGDHRSPTRPSFNGVSNILPSVVEESTSPSTNVPPSHVYKVVYLGNSGVGKSSVIRWLSTGSFRSETEATIGMDYITRMITVDNEPVLLQLWDTAGQERFGPITAVYCRRADAFILVYDITNRSSFVGIKGWTDVIKATLRDESSVLLLIGNKRDVSHGDREVSTREGEKLAEQLGAIFMETSARSGNNVIKAHEELSRKLLEREDEIMNEARMAPPPTLYIGAVNSLNKRKCFC